MKPNIIDDRTLALTISRRWLSFLSFFILSFLIMWFCFALTPSAANAWNVTLTNPGTGGGTVRWGFNGQPWKPDQHLGSGESVVIVAMPGDYIYFDAIIGAGVGPDADSEFTHPDDWGGDGYVNSGVDPNYWFLPSITGNRSVTVTFDLKPVVTVNSPGAGSGGVTDKDGANMVNSGDSITITPTPDAGYRFLNWTGDASGSDDPLIVTNITADMTITANFQKTYTLAMLPPNGTGSGTVDPEYGYAYTFDEGTVVDITATPSLVPAPGSVFKQWNVSSGDPLDLANPTAASTTVTMNGNMAISATFDQGYEISFNNTSVSVSEDAGSAVFTVSLDRAITGPETVTVQYATADGTALQPGDYTLTSGTLTFNSGTGASLPITVPVSDDGFVEVDEDFTVQLTITSANATIPGSDTATGTITNNDAYTVSISNVSPSPAVEGTDTKVTFTVSLANVDPVDGVVGEVKVDGATVDGTAKDGTDYTGGISPLSFSGMTATYGVEVTILNDAHVEGDETFQFDLSNPVGCTIAGTDPETVTIQDDGVDAYTVSISNVSKPTVVEGTDADVTFTVSLANVDANGVVGTVNVDYATVDATAKDVTDYMGDTNTLTFTGMTSSADVVVPIVNDVHVENDETFQFDLSNPVGCSIAGTDPETVTIQDDGVDAYTVSISNVSKSTVVEGTDADVTFTVSLDTANIDPANGMVGLVNVVYATVEGTAKDVTDYTGDSNTLALNDVTTSQNVVIPIVNDTHVENDETFQFDLSNPVGCTIAGTDPETVTIKDDADVYNVRISSVDTSPVTEANTNVTVTITLENVDPANGVLPDVSVEYETKNGTASEGKGDYTKIPKAKWIFTSDTKTFDVQILDDPLVENDEDFQFLLSNFSGPRIGSILPTNPAIITIHDIDMYDVSVQGVSPDPVAEANADVKFALVLANFDTDTGLIGPISVDYATGGGDATPVSDYVTTNGTFPFAGESGEIKVPVLEDDLVENDETFNFTLSNFLGARAGDITGGPATATIQEDDDKYEVAITGVSMNPVTEADTVITFTLALTDVDPTHGVIGPLTVDYETIDDKATSGLDYAGVSPAVTLTFTNAIETVDVAIKNDTLVENDEAFQFKLSNFAGARKGSITNDKQDVTIQDDADTYDVTVQSVSPDPAVEGTDGKVTFTLALANVDPTHGIIVPATVDYATGGGSATAGSDYNAVSGTQTFSADTETIDVTVLDDSFVENDETFDMSLSGFNAGARTGSTGGSVTATIQDDGVDAYTVSISNVSKSTVVEGTDADVTFTVSLANMDPANGVAGTAQVDVATVDGTAVDGDDFTGGSNTLIFSGSTDVYNVVVPIKNDIYPENDENFYLDLSNPVSCTITGTDPETVTIQDDGGDAYDVAVDSPSPVTEGPSKKITFTVTLANVDPKNGVKGTVNVDYATADASAVAGSDYTAIPTTTMTFVNGDAPSKTFDVTVLQDAVVENQETFSVNLSNFDGGGATGGPGTGRINDDPDTYNVSVDSPPAVVEAGGVTITFTVTLNNVDSLNGVSRAVHVDYATADASAVAGNDYTGIPTTTMTFNPGDGPTKTFDVTVLQDTLVENPETFNLVLSNFDGGGATGAAGKGTINDDGDTYGIFVDDQTVAEGVTATFTVSLDQAPLSTHSVKVDYATSNGTALDTQDYTGTSGSFTFTSGQTTKTFLVPVTDDAVVEFAENFFVDLSNASVNATILDPQGEGTIPIDEKYQVSIDDVTVGEPGGNILPGPVSTTTVTFTVSLDQPAIEGAPVTLDFATSDASAVAGGAGSGDYDSILGTLSFDGVDTQTITVTVNNDGEVDPAEVFAVNLTNANPASITEIADNRGECTITDDDYTLTLSNPASGSGTVDVSAGSVSGLGGANDLALGPGDSVDFIYQAGDVVTLSDEKEATLPDPGSRFKGHSANPVTIAGDETVTSTFVQLYWLTPVPVSHGTMAPDTPQIVEHGEGLAFTAASDLPDYTIVDDVLVDGASVNGATAPATPALNSTTYTFTNVTANHDIGAIISDYGDDCSTAAPVCCPPDVSTHNGEISPAGDWDYFKVVTPTVGTLKAYTSGSTDTYGYLLDTNCNPDAPITRNDDKDQHNTNFYIEERNIPAGTYYVAVKHWERWSWNPVGTGPYTLHVEFNSDDHGSDPSSATLVTCNSSVGGNLETAGNEDYFAIDLSGDGNFTVYTTGTTDTVGTLMDSSPAILTQDNNSGTGDNFLIQRNLVKGKYYVGVSHNDSLAGTGAYTLNVDCELTHSIWATAGFGGSISPEGTVAVQEGQDETFTITPDGSNTVYDVEVDGKSVGGVTTYTFTNVQKNHTIVAYFQLPPDICLDISDTPLDARFQAAPANVMFVLDDSGSMDWTFLTPDSEGQFYFEGRRYRYVFDDPGDNLYGNVLSKGKPRRAWKSQWSGYNRIYYNPNVTYDPWPTLSDAHGDFPRSHPWHASPTFNLGLTYQTVDTGAATDLTIVVDDEDPSPYFEKGPDVVQVIINDRDPQFSKTASNGGDWRSSSSSEAYNDNYYYSRRVGDYTATWTPSFTSDGQYDVYARWADSTNRSKNVPYTMTYSDGVGGTLTDTVTVDQTVNGGKWVKLGSYFFSAGAGDVSINYHVSSTSDDRICADAIRFTPTGASWDWATHGDAYDNHYWWTPSNGDYWARWTPDLPVAGDWEVQVRWYGNNERSTGDRPDAVKYVITHAGGTTEYVPHPSQRKNSGVWLSLGTYTFNAGMGGNVTLTHTRTGAVDTICADAVRFIPPIPFTIDIKRAHYYTWDDTNGDTVINPGEVWLVVVDGSIKYYQFTDADGDDVVDTGELMPETDLANVPDSVKTGRTYVEERQNFANWYSFYRRRELTASAAVSRVISEMRGVNIGYYSINGLLKQPVLPVKVGVNDQTPTLLNGLYSMVLKSNSTPLRRGLRSVGRYFDADDGDSGGLGNSPFATASEGGECQQAFAIVMTDGYWNGGSPSLGNTDGDNNTNWDGNPYGDNYYNTLADVAMYFYERDLSSSLDDIVPVNPEDQATHQHMVTYTVAFGLEGSLNPDDYDFVNTFPTWPEPDSDANATKIDDLWHAAKNGRGQYLSAKNPEELIDQMLSIIHNIQSRIGSSSSVAVNGDELYETIGADIRMFQGTYSSDGWIGDVKAYTIDMVTGEVLINSPLWSSAEQLDLQNWDSGRQIATFDGVTGRPFRFDSLTDELKDLLDVNWTADDTTARAILNYVRGDTSNEQENGGTFRDRFQILGDIVHASPVHVNDILYSGANDGMLHAFDATTGNELFAYVPKLVFHNLKELKDPLYTHKYYVDLTPDTENIYVPAGGAYADGQDNDSDGDTDEADEMKLKTILVGGLGKGGRGYYALDITGLDPSTVFTEATVASRVMWEYPNPRVMNVTEGSCAAVGSPVVVTTAVPHGLSVGDTVEISGVHEDEADGTWNVTVVSSSTQFEIDKVCDDASGVFYSGSSGTATEIDPTWGDMGFSYSRPAIINSQAGYIVMFGNGYNSETGVAKLIILDLLTGEPVKIINTQAGGCNGLSSPVPIDVDFDDLVDYVYAGDLNGNLWKFDLTDASASNWDVAYKSAPYTGGVGTDPEPLFQARSAEGVPQPITSKPDVMDWCTTSGYMVTFGTGKWLGDFDYANTTTQTIYGIWDYGDDDDDSEYLGVFDRGATPQLSNQLDSVTLLEQTVLPCDPNISTCDGDFWVFNDKPLRVLTDNIASIVNPWGTTSEYNGGLDCGDGEGIIDCEPNSIGANPDPVKLAGWYFDLPLNGERSVSDALIREGRVIYVPYIPEDSPCGAGGDSVIMEMDACTGGQLTKPQFDINEDGVIDENDFINVGTADDPIWVAPSGIKAEGKLQPPAILRVPDSPKERKYFSSTRGKIVTVDEKAVTLGITYWLEFE
jgi:Tfp pilus tip-associated adhesin PilY1